MHSRILFTFYIISVSFADPSVYTFILLSPTHSLQPGKVPALYTLNTNARVASESPGVGKSDPFTHTLLTRKLTSSFILVMACLCAPD